MSTAQDEKQEVPHTPKWKADSPLFSGATVSIDIRIAGREAGFVGTFSRVLPNGQGYIEALEQFQAHVDQIVLAHNSHDQLVAACHAALEMRAQQSDASNTLEEFEVRRAAAVRVNEIADQIRAALSAIKDK